MAIFRRRAASAPVAGGRIPGDIEAMMEAFARYELDPAKTSLTHEELGAIWHNTQQPLVDFAMASPADFVEELYRAVHDASGLAQYGALRTVWNLVSEVAPTPAYVALADAGVAFLRASRVPPMRVPNREWDHWLAQGGTLDEWLPRRPIPDATAAPIRPLAPDESRRVAVLTPEHDANVVLVERSGDEVVAVIDAKWSDEDPRRVQNEWKRAASLYDLYVDIGLALQVPPHWFDPELGPYFPLEAPLV